MVKPVGYEKHDRRVAMMLFLHGGGEGGEDLVKVLKHGPPKLAAGGKPFEFLMVAPQNPSLTQHWDDQRLMQLVEKVEAEERIDPERIYLAGLSRGAYGVWRLAIQNPDKFAAMIAVCGGGDAPYVKRLKSLPIWVFHGAKDNVIPIGESEQMVAGLKKVGGNIRFTVYPDAKHDSWTETYANEEVYRWLLRQSRTKIE
ncbi:MAG: prolyl oligopeptidase family serine peptidase [Planctomycetota bacterium]